MSFFTLIVGVMSAVPTAIEVYDVIPSESVFAMVTHKAGIASGLAHDHFIYASRYQAEASFDMANPEQVEFRIRFAVTDLTVDDPAAERRWFPGVKAAGILTKPFPDVSEKDRAAVRKSMLGEEQLDAGRFPEMSAELKRLTPRESTAGSKTFAYEAIVALTVHGRTVERPFRLNVQQSDDTVHVEGFGAYNFTDFGIRPYSGFLGAVRNKDLFHVFVDMKARRR